MDDGLPERLLGVTTFVLARAGRAGRARMGALADGHGLGLWHVAVLAALAEGPPVSQRALGTRLGIDPSDLVEVVGRLEGLGLARRERDPADRRRYLVEPTAAGRAELDAVTAGAARLDAELLAPLDPGERAQLHALLLRVLAHHDPRAGGVR
ncbi:MarR family winged helix-turn-helix transcriptional regulator [Actinomadura parmotrematis]|uniref:MarR family winged helix-turn-helix transcriptional regulator n=1 Tax=Actinomadura parmotrematis TaxID=2864039 RepID=A0ABS7G439_9ACTN|nr:MarR family winged helix-turn-helix transcriptional regulator [Actinomadura parmotrematis]MBW8487120.1 MarR family winged helix-turn-helix transcriptional regulator [Actinomadura parmotrematis]